MEMEKIGKKLSWLSLCTLIFVTLGTIFGCLVATEVGKYSDGGAFKTIVLIIVLLAAAILVITNLIGFFTMRKGDLKTSLVAMGRQSSIQTIGPFLALILAIVGIFVSANEAGLQPNYVMVAILIVTFVAFGFVAGMNNRGLKAFRKDKGTYTYVATTSYIAAGILLVFGVVACVGMLQIPGLDGTHVIGFAETFAIMFILANLVSYLSLGIFAFACEKYAPRVTMADADSADLSKINANVTKLVDNISTVPAKQTSNAEKLREYKSLLDDGIITKEEFEAKKKELL